MITLAPSNAFTVKKSVKAFIASSLLMVGFNSFAADAELFTKLPNYCPTPDAFAIAPDGSLTVSCPNIANSGQKVGVLLSITPEGKVTKLAKSPGPGNNFSGKGRPMGIVYGSDGALYVADNQSNNRGRVLRLTFAGGELMDTEVIAYGMNTVNGITIHGDYLYATQTKLPRFGTELITSGVYRFSIYDRNFRVKNNRNDTTLIFKEQTENLQRQVGLDGIVVDENGDLLVSDFGDGTIFKLTMNDGEVQSSEIYAQLPSSTGADGITLDDDGNLYVAGFLANQVVKVDTDRKVSILAENGDTDGSDGGLDQPADLIIYNGKLVVSNFDLMSGSDMVNSGYDGYHSLSSVDVE